MDNMHHFATFAGKVGKGKRGFV